MPGSVFALFEARRILRLNAAAQLDWLLYLVRSVLVLRKCLGVQKEFGIHVRFQTRPADGVSAAVRLVAANSFLAEL